MCAGPPFQPKQMPPRTAPWEGEVLWTALGLHLLHPCPDLTLVQPQSHPGPVQALVVSFGPESKHDGVGLRLLLCLDCRDCQKRKLSGA